MPSTVVNAFRRVFVLKMSCEIEQKLEEDIVWQEMLVCHQTQFHSSYFIFF